MGKKLGRNDPCWCGSGKKYKNCHLGREDDTKISPWDIEKERIKNYSAKRCLAPAQWRHKCSKNFGRAHTIPKSGSLLKIARDGHVYCFSPRLANLIKNNGIAAPQLIGISRASTFHGFCTTHDNLIFSPIEKQSFSSTAEQCFLLAYRSFCREYFTKIASMKSQDLLANAHRGKPLYLQHKIKSINKGLALGTRIAIRNLKQIKPIYDQILISRNFEPVEAYVVELKHAPPVMCSGGFYPEVDFLGNRLQILGSYDSIPHQINFTAFFGGEHGALVFTWLNRDSATCIPFIKSLDSMPEDHFTNATIRLIFEHIENSCIHPEWWEKLPSDHQQAIMQRMTYSGSPFSPRYYDALTDDGFVFEPWEIVSRRWIGVDPDKIDASPK